MKIKYFFYFNPDSYRTRRGSASLLEQDLPRILLVTLKELRLARLQMANHSRRLQVRTLLIRPRRHCHNSTQRRPPEYSPVGTLHVRDQLADVAVQRNILVTLQVLECGHESRDECLEDGANHLALRASAQSATEVGRVPAACRTHFGSV